MTRCFGTKNSGNHLVGLITSSVTQEYKEALLSMRFNAKPYKKLHFQLGRF